MTEILSYMTFEDRSTIVFGGVEFVFRQGLPVVDARVVKTNLRGRRYARAGGLLLKRGLTWFVDNGFAQPPVKRLWLRFNRNQGVLARIAY